MQHSLKCLPIPVIDALGRINDLEAGPALIARLIAQLRSAETIQEREVAAPPFQVGWISACFLLGCMTSREKFVTLLEKYESAG